MRDRSRCLTTKQSPILAFNAIVQELEKKRFFITTIYWRGLAISLFLSVEIQDSLKKSVKFIQSQMRQAISRFYLVIKRVIIAIIMPKSNLFFT